MGVMVILPVADFACPSGSTVLVTFACGTGNLGNGCLLEKLSTTKYPLGLILVELSYQLSLRRAALRAQWIPGLQNEEADALTNFQFDRFNLGRRIPVDIGELKLKFGVFSELHDQGEVYVKELGYLKAEAMRAGALHAMAGAKRKRAAEDTLEVKNPWQASAGSRPIESGSASDKAGRDLEPGMPTRLLSR